MKKSKETVAKKLSPGLEDIKDLQNQTTKNNEVKKGYNEHNPTQPQGAFIPDAKNTKN